MKLPGWVRRLFIREEAGMPIENGGTYTLPDLLAGRVRLREVPPVKDPPPEDTRGEPWGGSKWTPDFHPRGWREDGKYSPESREWDWTPDPERRAPDPEPDWQWLPDPPAGKAAPDPPWDWQPDPPRTGGDTEPEWRDVPD